MRNEAQCQNQSLAHKAPLACQSLQALKLSIEIGDLRLFEEILATEIDINELLPGHEGCTPLSYCVLKNQRIMARLLVIRGLQHVKLNSKSFRGEGQTFFHYAVSYDDLQLLQELMKTHPLEFWDLMAPLHPIHIAITARAKRCLDFMLRFKIEDLPAGWMNSPSFHRFKGYRESLSTRNCSKRPREMVAS